MDDAQLMQQIISLGTTWVVGALLLSTLLISILVYWPKSSRDRPYEVPSSKEKGKPPFPHDKIQFGLILAIAVILCGLIAKLCKNIGQ